MLMTFIDIFHTVTVKQQVLNSIICGIKMSFKSLKLNLQKPWIHLPSCFFFISMMIWVITVSHLFVAGCTCNDKWLHWSTCCFCLSFKTKVNPAPSQSTRVTRSMKMQQQQVQKVLLSQTSWTSILRISTKKHQKLTLPLLHYLSFAKTSTASEDTGPKHCSKER